MNMAAPFLWLKSGANCGMLTKKGETSMEERYRRNIPALSEREQALLGEKRALLVGCGGLGGYLAEYLTRMGIGALTAVDGDVFEPSNLNRQLGCTSATLGQGKARVLCDRAEAVRPGVRFRAVDNILTAENAAALVKGQDVVLDALDDPAARLLLEDACTQANVPLVHGAVQGWTAQVAVCLPGSGLLRRLYRGTAPAAEADKTCLSFTPGLCAALQAAEAVKVLLGSAPQLTGKVLTVDLKTMEANILPV